MFLGDDDEETLDREYLWGTLAEEDNSELVGLSQAEKDHLIRLPRPLPLDGPRIHQPGIPQEPSTSVTSFQFERPKDPYVYNGIKLLAYLRDRSECSDLGNGVKGRIPSFPTDIDPSLPITATSEPFGYVIRQETDFTAGKYLKSELRAQKRRRLDAVSTRQVLHKAVSTICAFVGYESSTESALDVFTDVVGDYLRNFCKHLRFAKDRESIEGTTGFPDIIEKVCHDMGIGTVLNIQRYYENNVIKYYKRILRDCNNGKTSGIKTEQSSFKTKNGHVVKEEADYQDDQDIPELHFPSSEEGTDGDHSGNAHSTPQLETGLQMLQSLESQVGGMVPSVDEPMSHDSNSAIMMATVSPASVSSGGPTCKRRKTSEKS